MTLSAIVDRIVGDARAAAGRARAAGANRAREILAAAEAEARARAEAALKAGGEELKGKREARISQARLEERMKLLALKRDLVDRVFEASLASLPQRPTDEYAAFLVALVAPAVAGEPAELKLGRGDLGRHGPELQRLVSFGLAARHPGWPLTLSEEPGDFEAGIVVRAGHSVHDFSLPALFARHRDHWELPVSRTLFSP